MTKKQSKLDVLEVSLEQIYFARHIKIRSTWLDPSLHFLRLYITFPALLAQILFSLCGSLFCAISTILYVIVRRCVFCVARHKLMLIAQKNDP